LRFVKRKSLCRLQIAAAGRGRRGRKKKNGGGKKKKKKGGRIFSSGLSRSIWPRFFVNGGHRGEKKKKETQ